MATKDSDLQKQINELKEQNRQMAAMMGLSVATPAEDVTERADYIEHGSPQHAVFLGLIQVGEQDMEDAKLNDYILYESPITGKTWRLEDEISPFTSFPNPEKIARLVLRQKVSSLESGPPTVPADAPPLLVPSNAF